ncbi:MAG: hypothetical protein AAGF56_13045 [Pseudomonadota bacterium]
MTYAPIDPSETLPDAPIVSSLMTRLAQNPVAIAGGLAGAPRIVEEARGGSVAGDLLLFSSHGIDVPVGFTATDQVASMDIPRAFLRATTNCIVRATGVVSAVSSSPSAGIRVLKNGIVLQTQSSTGGMNVDVSLGLGDVCWFQVFGGVTQGGGETQYGSVTYHTIGFRTGAQRSCGGI